MHDRAVPAPLREHILLYLERQPADSVTRLAIELGVHRSSVSRTVNTLIVDGLVVREERRLLLTEAGQREAHLITTSVAVKAAKNVEKMERLVRRQNEVLRLAADPPLDAMRRQMEILENMVSGISPSQALLRDLSLISLDLPNWPLLNEFSVPIETILGTYDPSQFIRLVSENLGGISYTPLGFDLSTTAVIQSAFTGIAGIQRLNASLLEAAALAMPPTSRFSDLLADSNAALSRMMADLGAIAAVQTSSLLESLSRDVAETTRAYQAHIYDVTHSLMLQAEQDAIPLGRLSSDLYVPTLTTACLISSTRKIIEENRSTLEDVAVAHVELRRWEQEAATLDLYLDRLPARFRRQWHGAWRTLSSDSPDRVRQAAHSGREFLNQVLDYLAPDASFTIAEIEREGHAKANENKHPTRRMRIKYIVSGRGGSAVSFADCMAKALCETYDILSREAHSHSDEPSCTEEAMSGMLMSLGGLVRFLLSSDSSE